MNEAAARRVVLAQAIEAADAQGKLLSAVEREQIDAQSRQAAQASDGGLEHIAPDHFIELRARRVLDAVDARHPRIASLQRPGPWQPWLIAGAPVAAFLMGVATDAIGNPHRVDLVSLPLLGIVAWNLAMYIVLAGTLFVSGRDRAPMFASFGRWTDGARAMRRRMPSLPSQITALFHARWFAATQNLHVQRCKRVFHLSAAAWAAGVIASLLVRGLVVEYRVGWESTFLSASQVHAILSVLRLPALLLFPFEPLTLQEVAQLQFSRGGGAIAGARWVYMYVALLLVVVVVPRLVLAAVAYGREKLLARRVRINLGEPYFERILSLLTSTRVQLAVFCHRPEDRDALMRVLLQEPQPASVLITSAQDDVLRWVDISGVRAPASGMAGHAGAPAVGWRARLEHALGIKARAPDEKLDPVLHSARESDLVLHVSGMPGDAEAAHDVLEWVRRPVLHLTRHAAARPSPSAGLFFSEFAGSWVQEKVLLDAIARLLPKPKAPGFARIAARWEERNLTRLTHSMNAVAEHLVFAARQTEEVRGGALTVRALLPAQRQAQGQARQAATDAVVKRLDDSAATLFLRLREIHGIHGPAADSLKHGFEQKFIVQQAIDTPQAGVAGAATGAAMGASVDLLTGGLTLGAATALGALVGGGAGFLAAAWKNRSTAAGTSVVQLSDEMMQALVEAALLRYLVVAHHGREQKNAAGEPPLWRGEVVAAVEAAKHKLVPFWSSARTQPDAGRLGLALSRELEGIVRPVLSALFGVSPET